MTPSAPTPFILTPPLFAVVLAEALVVVDAVAVADVELLAALAFLRIPPWTLAGEELDPTLAAAARYPSRVSEPEGGLMTATMPP